MSVPFVPFENEYEALQNGIDDAVARVLASGWFILGNEVEQLESSFASYLRADHAIGVNSGTDALELALRALGVGDGDEVITVSHTYAATVSAIIEAGATPVLIDVDPETYCMDTSQIEAAVTPDTEAIIPVHLYGQPCKMIAIQELADQYDLDVIEDAAQAHGATVDGQRVGTIGDAGCFSFYPVKNLGAYGDGGAVVTDDDDVAERLKMLRDGGRSGKYHHELVGRNSRLDEMQAAILREKLPHLDDWNERRRSQAHQYDEALAGTVVRAPTQRPDGDHVYHLYVVRHDDRDALQDHLAAADINTIIHYPTPVHEQPAFEGIVGDVSLPATERICNKILSLPLHPYLTDKQIQTVIDAVRSFDYQRNSP